MIKECVICHINLEVPYYKNQTKYCSNCRKIALRINSAKYHERMTNIKNYRCKYCNKLLKWRNNKKKPPTECTSCHMKHLKHPPTNKKLAGKNNGQWNGGRYTDKDGYIFIYHPEPHPRRRKNGSNYYLAEHILNWEKANGIPLPPNHVVHHLNGVKYDNRPTNLVALPTARHSSGLVNKALQKRIRELEAIISQQRFNIQ